MLEAIAHIQTQVPANQFRWIDAKRSKWAVRDMETRHLFYTLRMIWNNRMPVPVPDNPRFYRFDQRTHSDDFLLEALVHVTRELFTRDDIKPQFQAQLDWMADQLARNQNYLTEPRKALQ